MATSMGAKAPEGGHRLDGYSMPAGTQPSDLYQTQHPADNSLIDGNITITTDGSTGFTVSTSQSGLLRNYSLDE